MKKVILMTPLLLAQLFNLVVAEDTIVTKKDEWEPS